MKTKSSVLDKSRPYGTIVGAHIVGAHLAAYEQDGVMFNAEGYPVGETPAPMPVAAPEPPPAAVTVEEPPMGTVIDEPTIGVDLQAYAEGNVKAPWVMVVRAVADAYGVTPASKADAIKIIRAGGLEDGKVCE